MTSCRSSRTIRAIALERDSCALLFNLRATAVVFSSNLWLNTPGRLVSDRTATSVYHLEEATPTNGEPTYSLTITVRKALALALLYNANVTNKRKYRLAKMAEAFSRALFTGEQVLDLLQAGDSDGEELCDDSFDEVFFPGSDDEP